MGHATGQRTHGLHLLGLAELFLKLFGGCNIFGKMGNAGNFIFFIGDGRGTDQKGLAQFFMMYFAGVGLKGFDIMLNGAAWAGGGTAMEDLITFFADQLFPAGVENKAAGLVDLVDLHVPVLDGHHIADGIKGM